MSCARRSLRVTGFEDVEKRAARNKGDLSKDLDGKDMRTRAFIVPTE